MDTVPAVPSLEELIRDLPAGSPIERLTVASLVAQRLHARGDELVDSVVAAARAQGASWSEIGSALTTSKQAAQQRFAVVAQPPGEEAPLGLTGAAADALGAAADEARRLGHHYVRPEHLILGLLSMPQEIAAMALEAEGVTADGARAHIVEQIGRSAPRPSGSLGVAPQTKRLLELARMIGQSLDHRCPRTEHVLLAAVSPKLQSSAAVLLEECGAPPSAVRDQLTRMILEQAPELSTRLTRRSKLARVGIKRP